MAAQPVGDLLADWDQKVAAWDAEQDLASRIEQQQNYIQRMTEQESTIPADLVDPPTDLRPGPIMDHNRPGNCNDGMIAPLAELSIKGVTCHRSYNNCFIGTPDTVMYRHGFPENDHGMTRRLQ